MSFVPSLNPSTCSTVKAATGKLSSEDDHDDDDDEEFVINFTAEASDSDSAAAADEPHPKRDAKQAKATPPGT